MIYFLIFRCFFKSNLVPVMVRYQLGVILEYIFLSIKFYRACGFKTLVDSRNPHEFEVIFKSKRTLFLVF